MKYDRHGYKGRNRVFIVTDKACFLLDASNFKVKEHFTFEEVQAVKVSHLTDGIVIIQLPSEGPDGRGDLILETDHVIEFVIKLALFAKKLQNVEVNTTNT